MLPFAKKFHNEIAWDEEEEQEGDSEGENPLQIDGYEGEMVEETNGEDILACISFGSCTRRSRY